MATYIVKKLTPTKKHTHCRCNHDYFVTIVFSSKVRSQSFSVAFKLNCILLSRRIEDVC